MARRIRDLAVTVTVLLVLFGILVSINPRVLERADEFTGDVSSQEWSSSGGTVQKTAGSVLTLISSYADDNTYLFAFLVVAVALFVLMLRT